MYMTRLPYSKTIGTDVTEDGYPDVPLRFEFEESRCVIQFPLLFCPGDRSDPDDPQRNRFCRGEWGFVLKEWTVITKTYPWSAANLNVVTKQVDIDVYDENDNLVDVSGFKIDIQILIERKIKAEDVLSFTDKIRPIVNVKHR